MQRRLVPIAALSIVCFTAPSLVTAQERAGVVTTVDGQASVTRPVVPRPQPLSFKDDVFTRDRITTAEQSLVRLLLGGKALVTVRELSTFTISEEPMRATVELQSGKIGVAAARQLFRPGERLEIRTPNAVAAIRGTLIIAETLANGEALFSVLTGLADVCRGASCVSIGAGERALASATSVRSERIPAGADPEAGLRPGGPQHTSAPSETTAEVAAQALQGATALTALLAPPPVTPTPQPSVTPPVLPNQGPNAPNPTVASEPPPVMPPPPPPPPPGNTLIKNGGFETGTLSGWTSTGAVSVVEGLGSRRPPEGQYMALMHTGTDSVNNTTSTLSQSVGTGSLFFVGVTYKFISGEFPVQSAFFNDTFTASILGGTEPVRVATETRNTSFDGQSLSTEAAVAPGLVIPAGRGETPFKTVDQLFHVDGEGDKTLEFRLADVGDANVDSAVLIDSVVVELDPPRYYLHDGRAYARLEPSPLETFVGRTETFDSFMVTCCGSTVDLGGPLLHAVDSHLDVPFGLLNVMQGGVVRSTTTEPFVLLERGTYALGTRVGIFNISGVSTAVDPDTGLRLGTDEPLQLAGPLFESRGAEVAALSVLKIDTAVLEATMPLIKMIKGATLTTAESLVALTGQAQLTALGPLAGLDQSSITVRNGAALALAGGSVVRVTGDAFVLSNGSRLTVLNGALVSVAGGSVLRISGSLIAFGGTGGNVVSVNNNLCPCTILGGVPVALSNGAVASNVRIGADVVKNATLGSVQLSPNAALIAVSGSTSKVSIGRP